MESKENYFLVTNKHVINNKKELRERASEISVSFAEEFGISKKELGRRINFVKDSFQRNIIFRDIEHEYVLEKKGFSKPTVILAGAVIEDLLRLYMIHNV